MMTAPAGSEWTATARWILPVGREPLARGTITLAGERIVAVERPGARAPDVDFGNAAILPGFVNAHTHLDLTGLRGRCPPGPDFTGWLRSVIRHRRWQSAEQCRADVRAGLEQSVAFGSTLLGDISAGGRSWDVLADAPVRSVVYHEILGLTEGRASAALNGALDWLKAHPATTTCRPGVSPHAPYSVRAPLFFGAATLGVPVAVHLAESAEELQLLQLRNGPFVPFLKELGVWDVSGLAESPTHVLHLLNNLAPVAIAHGNYLNPAEPVPRSGRLVFCPRTHAAFGHPAHPFREFLARGVRVALGTDSLASNPDLDVLGEARFLHARYPDVAGATVLRMATLSGAEALGWQDETGSLAVGKSADLVVLPLPNEEAGEPHGLVLESSNAVSAVLCRGKWVHQVVTS